MEDGFLMELAHIGSVGPCYQLQCQLVRLTIDTSVLNPLANHCHSTARCRSIASTFLQTTRILWHLRKIKIKSHCTYS